MEVMAIGGQFSVSMMRLGDWKHEWNKKDGTLSIWGKARAVSVTTNRGEFIEAVDPDGNVLHEGGDGQWFYVPVTKEKTKLRFKKLPDPKLTKAELDKARKSTTVTVADQERYDGGPFEFGASYTDGTLDRVIESLEKIRASIPAQYRNKARCEIDSESGYEGSHYAHIEVSYERQETDEEVIERVKIDRERARIMESAERAQLDSLKSKYSAKEKAAQG